MWPEIKTDDLGKYVQVLLSRDLYNDVTIFKAAYWLTDRQFIFLDVAPDGRLLVELRPKPASQTDLQTACAEFCNHLIDFRLRDIVISETRAIREALVTKAFSEGIVTPGIAGAESDERYLNGKVI